MMYFQYILDVINDNVPNNEKIAKKENHILLLNDVESNKYLSHNENIFKFIL